MLLPSTQPLHTKTRRHREDNHMNKDNQRLLEIKQYKNAYYKLMDKAETLTDILEYKSKIDELETEEKEILERFDVII